MRYSYVLLLKIVASLSGRLGPSRANRGKTYYSVARSGYRRRPFVPVGGGGPACLTRTTQSRRRLVEYRSVARGDWQVSPGTRYHPLPTTAKLSAVFQFSVLFSIPKIPMMPPSMSNVLQRVPRPSHHTQPTTPHTPAPSLPCLSRSSPATPP